jgi:hypothetical protein
VITALVADDPPADGHVGEVGHLAGDVLLGEHLRVPVRPRRRPRSRAGEGSERLRAVSHESVAPAPEVFGEATDRRRQPAEEVDEFLDWRRGLVVLDLDLKDALASQRVTIDDARRLGS